MTLIQFPPVQPLFIHSASQRFTAAAEASLMGAFNQPGSTAWPSANRAIYIPLSLPFAYPASRVFWWNGAAVAGNIDLGIFSIDGTKLFSVGATAQSGTNVVQYATANWLVGPGSFFLALAASSASADFLSVTSAIPAANMRAMGCLQQASAEPLPSSMTPAAIASAFWPLFGLTLTSSGY